MKEGKKLSKVGRKREMQGVEKEAKKQQEDRKKE